MPFGAATQPTTEAHFTQTTAHLIKMAFMAFGMTRRSTWSGPKFSQRQVACCARLRSVEAANQLLEIDVAAIALLKLMRSGCKNTPERCSKLQSVDPCWFKTQLPRLWTSQQFHPRLLTHRTLCTYDSVTEKKLAIHWLWRKNCWHCYSTWCSSSRDNETTSTCVERSTQFHSVLSDVEQIALDLTTSQTNKRSEWSAVSILSLWMNHALSGW